MMRSFALVSALLVATTVSAQIQIRGGIGGRIVIQQKGGAVVIGNDKEEESPEDEFGSGRIFVENRSVTSALQGVRKEIENLESLEGQERIERMQRAVTALQKILDLERDFAYYPTDDDRSFIQSAKAEAEHLLLTLPTEGLELYRTEFGPQARAALDEAIAESNVSGIEEVVRRYFHTTAGREATYRLGSYHLDRAEPLAAALVFERIRALEATVDPGLALKTAIAWGRAGMPDQSVKTLVEFRDGVPGGFVQIGGERVALFNNETDALPWLVKVLGRQPEFASLGEEQWTMFRGSPTRTATTRPTSPIWDVRWRYTTVERPGDFDEKRLLEIVEEFARLEMGYRERSLLTTPAMHAIVVGETVVFRTFHNLRAVDLKSGETVWESAVYDEGFDRLLEGEDLNVQNVQNVNGRRIALPTASNGIAVTPAQKFLAQRAWRDMTAGTLASDGRFVFSVEELDFISGTQMAPNGLMINVPTTERGHTNKLMATEVRTGKLTWELGGVRGDDEFQLAGGFFLGPPLPLGNRLYSLVERNGEIQLAVVETIERKWENQTLYRPNVQWTQSLITPNRDITMSPLRRLAGLTPSYGDGVVVCPTASGAVVAVDLARRQLAWGYRYRTTSPSVPGNPFIGRRMAQTNTTEDDAENRWLDSAPTIADGYVVLTPRDSAELHCIDLVSGKRAWEPKPRGDGLYVAGVHEGNVIVVGHSQIQAYRLTDGTPTWSDPIPIAGPTGRGIRSGSLYHLPVRAGIVTIDLDAGRILATAKSPTGHAPGNLVSAAGTIVSVTPRHVMALEPLADIEKKINSQLEKTPNDPEALTRRGELRLHQGHEQAALEDLRKAIEAGAGQPTRDLFVATLLEGLRLDFARYREQADAALPLIEDSELKRSYLRLHARGLEQIGDHERAFAEYVELAGLANGEPHLERTTNGRLAVRSDRWIRPRLVELLENAPEAQRASMTKSLDAELADAEADDDVARLRRIVGAFGRLPIADRARRALVGKLTTEDHAAERVLLLERLRRSADESFAAYATAELAASALADGRGDDVVSWFDELESRYGDVVCLEGRTGRELVASWREDAGVAKALVARNPWPETAMSVTEENNAGGIAQSWPLDVQGPAGPFYDDWTFELDNQRQTLIARDPQARIQWRIGIREGGAPIANPYGNFVRIRGHVVVACFSTYFAVIDPLHASGQPKVLWTRELQEGGDNTANVRNFAGAGVIRMMVVDRYGRPLGTVGAVVDDVVYYQSGTKLFAADLLSGDVLWERRNVGRGAVVTADDDHVIVIEDDGKPATILRADDGRFVDQRTIPDTNERIEVQGRYVLALTADPNGNTAGRELALRDVVGKTKVWSVPLPATAKISLVEGEEVAVYEPTGRFRVLRIADGSTVVDEKITAVPATGITVVRSAEQYVLLPNTPPQGPVPAIVRVAGIGFNAPVVHGEVVGFDRATGKKQWTTKVEFQSLPNGQPQRLPLLVFSTRNFRIQQQPGRVVNANRYELRLLDTRTGKIVFEHSDAKPSYPYTLESKPEQGELELTFMQQRLRINFKGEGDDTKGEATTEEPATDEANSEETAGEEPATPTR